jgi:hypothetical protein
MAIVSMVAGVVLKKESGPTPLERLSSFSSTGPGQVESTV